jgi:hypothetical protein
MYLQHRAGAGSRPGIDLEDLGPQRPGLLGEAATRQLPVDDQCRGIVGLPQRVSGRSNEHRHSPRPDHRSGQPIGVADRQIGQSDRDVDGHHVRPTDLFLNQLNEIPDGGTEVSRDGGTDRDADPALIAPLHTEHQRRSHQTNLATTPPQLGPGSIPRTS